MKNKLQFEILPVTISSLQIMQTVSVLAKSSAVASGYKVFRLRIARRERITSLSAFLNDLFYKSKAMSGTINDHNRILKQTSLLGTLV